MSYPLCMRSARKKEGVDAIICDAVMQDNGDIHTGRTGDERAGPRQPGSFRHESNQRSCEI